MLTLGVMVYTPNSLVDRDSRNIVPEGSVSDFNKLFEAHFLLADF